MTYAATTGTGVFFPGIVTSVVEVAMRFVINVAKGGCSRHVVDMLRSPMNLIACIACGESQH